MIIERPYESERIEKSKKWVLVYGRRKTGKTFIVENFVRYDEFFFIKRDKSIISKKDNSLISYETFIEILKRELQNGKTIVIDEFQRLKDDFFDFLHYTKKQGKLILISSTLYLSKKLLSEKSPLLGLFSEVPVGLISLKDCMDALKKYKFSKKEILELSILLREPIAIDYFDEKKETKEIFTEILISSRRTIPALIGEAFIEEEREISNVYEGILRAIASGKVVSSEISNYLFSRRLIKKDDPSIIQQYLNNFVSFGIIKKIQIFNRNRFIYKHISPLMKVFYYADEKYNISERNPNEKEFSEIMGVLMPRLVEDNVREFFADNYGLIETIFETKDYDIDALLLKFKKPEMVIEIKWKKLTKEDVATAERNLGKYNAKKILFVPDKTSVQSSLDVMDPSDIV